jgi:hypothetical protein
MLFDLFKDFLVAFEIIGEIKQEENNWGEKETSVEI